MVEQKRRDGRKLERPKSPGNRDGGQKLERPVKDDRTDPRKMERMGDDDDDDDDGDDSGDDGGDGSDDERNVRLNKRPGSGTKRG